MTIKNHDVIEFNEWKKDRSGDVFYHESIGYAFKRAEPNFLKAFNDLMETNYVDMFLQHDFEFEDQNNWKATLSYENGKTICDWSVNSIIVLTSKGFTIHMSNSEWADFTKEAV